MRNLFAVANLVYCR